MTESRVKTTLLEDAVIAENQETTKTGAQSLAPGHSPRRAYQETMLPVRGLVEAGASMQQSVEEFLFYQAELLDGQHWQAYVDLFREDGIYWAPVTKEQTEWLDSPSIFAEDKNMLQVRLERITHPNAWSQAAEWALSHMVGSVVIESASETEVQTRSRFQVMELRRDNIRHFGGTYRHTLIREGKDWKIKLQRVDIVNGQAPYDYVIQAWL